MARFAGQREDGRYPYVVTTRWVDQEEKRLVWELDILHARMAHSFNREPHTTVKVRRATTADVAELEMTDRG